MTEEEKLIIAKICRNEKLRKKNPNNVLEPDTMVVVNYMLMNKTIVQPFLFKHGVKILNRSNNNS